MVPLLSGVRRAVIHASSILLWLRSPYRLPITTRSSRRSALRSPLTVCPSPPGPPAGLPSGAEPQGLPSPTASLALPSTPFVLRPPSELPWVLVDLPAGGGLPRVQKAFPFHSALPRCRSWPNSSFFLPFVLPRFVQIFLPFRGSEVFCQRLLDALVLMSRGRGEHDHVLSLCHLDLTPSLRD